MRWMSLSVRSAPNMGAIKSRAFPFRTSVLAGFSFVPGGKRVKWLTVRPSRMVTSPRPPRSGVVQFGISHHLHALHGGAYLGVVHMFARVAIRKRDGAIDQGRGEQV